MKAFPSHKLTATLAHATLDLSHMETYKWSNNQKKVYIEKFLNFTR